MTFTRTQCPLCTKTADFRHVETHSDSKTNTSYTLYRCSMCTGSFWEPLKNPGGAWYEHDERYADRNKNPILDPNWNHRKIVSFLAPKKGSVLDVGCGVGNFLAYAVSKGWAGVGIDFDRDAIEAGKKTFGLSNLSVSDIHDFAKIHTAKKFDLVTFFDVLEHIDDHEVFMADVHALLAEDGSVALSVPHGTHAKFLMPADVPPRHLTRWNEKSLKIFLKKYGFEITYLKKIPATIRFIILKLRFTYGKSVSTGLVAKAQSAGGKKRNVAFVSALAKIKDAVIFGIPATLIWLWLLPSQRRFIGLYVIARLRETSDGQAKRV